MRIAIHSFFASLLLLSGYAAEPPQHLYLAAGNKITVFAIDGQSGMLSEVQREPVRGSWPRNFAIDPSGHWMVVAGQRSNTVALFRVDPENGRLEFARSVVNVPDPTCVLFEKTR